MEAEQSPKSHCEVESSIMEMKFATHLKVTATLLYCMLAHSHFQNAPNAFRHRGLLLSKAINQLHPEIVLKTIKSIIENSAMEFLSAINSLEEKVLE